MEYWFVLIRTSPLLPVFVFYLQDMFAISVWINIQSREIRYQEIKFPIHQCCYNVKDDLIQKTYKFTLSMLGNILQSGKFYPP